jgi:hypothetical protein
VTSENFKNRRGLVRIKRFAIVAVPPNSRSLWNAACSPPLSHARHGSLNRAYGHQAAAPETNGTGEIQSPSLIRARTA